MAAETVIGPTIVIDGEIRSSEDISVRGTIRGKLKTSADVMVEETGTVEAEVETRSIEVRGAVIGNVQATERYQVMKDARVLGDVEAPRVVIADGARFKGHIEMPDTRGGGGEAAPKAAPTRTGRR